MPEPSNTLTDTKNDPKTLTRVSGEIILVPPFFAKPDHTILNNPLYAALHDNP
jgi:hypothetical protein